MGLSSHTSLQGSQLLSYCLCAGFKRRQQVLFLAKIGTQALHAWPALTELHLKQLADQCQAPDVSGPGCGNAVPCTK